MKLCHCEPDGRVAKRIETEGEAIPNLIIIRLLRRFAPRNDI